ncbi:heme-binding protein [Duganella sp. BuS-21]|uniref:GlcG/HbpS family heme-binding protein n=1 Tax=Duganella sp. BuS-21 TaxID=2943848 RepID=UPI0035A6DD0B
MTYHSRPLLALALAAAMAPASAAAPLQVTRPDITLEGAMRLLEATMEACHAGGKTLAAAVVDRSGNLVALQRDDNVGPHNTLAAQRKAYTALSTKSATGTLADNARANTPTNNLNTVSELLLLGGGVPVSAGTAIIGAIGVAGAGGPGIDESCALSAIARVFPPRSN